ncbi:MAG: hypothetical protein GY830_06470 [Bacteroidetes bacterium]|nr:hypothetical protein [Bacteroidota bacterium]
MYKYNLLLILAITIGCQVDDENNFNENNYKTERPLYTNNSIKTNSGSSIKKANLNSEGSQNIKSVKNKDNPIKNSSNSIYSDTSDIEEQKDEQNEYSRQKYTKDQFYEIINRAFRTGNSESIISIIKNNSLSKEDKIYILKGAVKEINHDHSSVLAVLLNNGIKVDEELFETVNYSRIKNKVTPLMLSVTHNYQITEFLLNNGANPNARDSFGNTPLHISCKSGCSYFNTIELLLEKTSAINDLNSPNAEQKTALDVLCDNKQKSYDYMVNKGAEHNNILSFALACKFGDFNIAKIHVKKITDKLDILTEKINNKEEEIRRYLTINYEEFLNYVNKKINQISNDIKINATKIDNIDGINNKITDIKNFVANIKTKENFSIKYKELKDKLYNLQNDIKINKIKINKEYKYLRELQYGGIKLHEFYYWNNKKYQTLMNEKGHFECDFGNTKRELCKYRCAIEYDRLDIYKLLLEYYNKYNLEYEREDRSSSFTGQLPSKFYEAIQKDNIKVLEYILEFNSKQKNQKDKIKLEIKSLDGIDPNSKTYALLDKYGYKHIYPISREIRRNEGKDIESIKVFIKKFDFKKEDIKCFITTLRYGLNNTKQILDLLFENGLKLTIDDKIEKRKGYIEDENELFYYKKYKYKYSSIDLVEECISQYKGFDPNVKALEYLLEKNIIKDINRKAKIEHHIVYDRSLDKNIKKKSKYPLEYLEIYRIFVHDYNNTKDTFDKIMDLLISKGNLELKNKDFTILHFASKSCKWYPSGPRYFLEYVLDLIKNKKLKIDINQKDNSGKTPLDYQEPGNIGYQLIKNLGGKNSTEIDG